jgi:DNA-binding response OmpR family regulator
MATKTKVLLAEDDKNLGSVLRAYLEAKGYNTTLCVDGKEALETFKRNEFDFCILDIMMPVMDGFTLAKEIRKMDKKIPFLFLTAKSMQEDKIHGFELGADDYLTKPFSMEELLLRIQAINRRIESMQKEKAEDNLFKFGAFTFDYNRQLLILDKNQQKLTSKEADLLKLLCLNINDVLDRSVALNKIWYDDSYFNARSMDVYITKLRKYLKEDPTVELINVHGVGFKLVVQNA